MSKAGEVLLVGSFFAGLWLWVRSRAGYGTSATSSGATITVTPNDQIPSSYWDDPFAIYNFTQPGEASSFWPVETLKAADMEKVSSEVDWLARTIWGEARGEGAEGMSAVANVIANRVASSRFPGSFEGVVTQKGWSKAAGRYVYQFSMWAPGEHNGEAARLVTAADPSFASALKIAKKAVDGTLPDATGGALHYYATWIPAPYWASSAKSSKKIGQHVFLVGVA